jgi:hypothetical protein
MNPNQRPTTLASRFGFQDPDLTNPVHDAILLWLIDHIQPVIDRLSEPLVEDFGPQLRLNLEAAIEDLKQIASRIQEHLKSAQFWAQKKPQDQPDQDIRRYTGDLALAQQFQQQFQQQLRDLPHEWPVTVSTESVARVRWEETILNGSYTVGFADLFVETTMLLPTLDCYGHIYSRHRRAGPPAAPLPDLYPPRRQTGGSLLPMTASAPPSAGKVSSSSPSPPETTAGCSTRSNPRLPMETVNHDLSR